MKIIFFVSILLSSIFCNAQSFTNEFGIRLCTVSLLFDDPQDYSKSNKYSPVLFQCPLYFSNSFFDGYNLYKIDCVRSSGIYLPELTFRKKISGIFWMRSVLGVQSIQSQISRPFSIASGTGTDYYEAYTCKTKQAEFGIDFQFQWLNKKYYSLYSSIGSGLFYYNNKFYIERHTYGCFNSINYVGWFHDVQKRIVEPNICTGINIHLANNFFLNWEIMYNSPSYFYLHNRLSVMKRF